jgi:hypothetical protein
MDKDDVEWMLDPVRGEYYYYDPEHKCYVYENGDIVYTE